MSQTKKDTTTATTTTATTTAATGIATVALPLQQRMRFTAGIIAAIILLAALTGCKTVINDQDIFGHKAELEALKKKNKQLRRRYFWRIQHIYRIYTKQCFATARCLPDCLLKHRNGYKALKCLDEGAGLKQCIPELRANAQKRAQSCIKLCEARVLKKQKSCLKDKAKTMPLPPISTAAANLQKTWSELPKKVKWQLVDQSLDNHAWLEALQLFYNSNISRIAWDYLKKSPTRTSQMIINADRVIGWLYAHVSLSGTGHRLSIKVKSVIMRTYKDWNKRRRKIRAQYLCRAADRVDGKVVFFDWLEEDQLRVCQSRRDQPIIMFDTLEKAEKRQKKFYRAITDPLETSACILGDPKILPGKSPPNLKKICSQKKLLYLKKGQFWKIFPLLSTNTHRTKFSFIKMSN